VTFPLTRCCWPCCAGGTANGEFARSLTLPGFLTRAAGAGALAAEKGLDFEYRMGRQGARRLERCRAGGNRGPGHRFSGMAVSLTLRRSAEIIAAKGGMLADITVGDVLELTDREAEYFTCQTRDHRVFYRMLRELGIFGDQAPERLRAFRTAGQLTPEELVDRYQLRCRPVRDLLVDYLRERQPAVDYTSLKMLAYYLAKRFWADLEEHHPGIGSLHLASEVDDAWKQRQRTKPQITTSPDGEKTVIMAERIGYRQCLTPGPGLLPGPVPVGARGPRPVGTVGRSLPGRAGRDQPAEVPAPPARRAWTRGPGNGCPSCRCWCAPSTNGARTPPNSCRPPARHSPARRSPPRARR
jgi:hypothetical protein